MDDFVRKILNDWGLNEWISKFKDECIKTEHLYCLEDQDIEKLISKVGPRAHFRRKLKQFKAEQNANPDTNPFPIQAVPSTSDKGKRKLDKEELNEGQPTPKRFQGKMSGSLSEQNILSDVKNEMRCVLAKLDSPPKTELNAFLRDTIKDLKIDKKEVVGVFGKTGVGKTSLINAVLKEEKLLPSGDVNACTSVMIKVEGNKCNTKYEAHIAFISTEEWKDELWSINQYIRETADKKNDDDDGEYEDEDYQDLAERLSAFYGEEWKHKTSEQLMDIRYFKEIPEFLHSEKKILSCKTAEELSDRIIKYTRTDSNHGGDKDVKSWYWPLVNCVTVKVPHNDLLQHVTLVDLPGNGDRNKSRDTMWKMVVGNCSTVWIVSEITRAGSDKESWEILKSVSSLLGNGGECKYIHFICTKSDINGCSTHHSAADPGALILARNRKAKEAVKKEFDKLKKIKKHFSGDCIQVFTVSSLEFLKPNVLTAANTEIPKLQDFLKNLNDCHSETLNYILGAYGILSLIEGAKLSNVNERKKQVCEVLKRKIAVQLQPIDQAMKEAYTAVENCLSKGVQKSKSSCEKKLKSILFPRGKNGSGYHRTLKSVLKNGGVYKTTKYKKVININMALTSFLTDSIDQEFKNTFPNEQKCGPFNGVIDKFSLDTKCLEKYKEVKLHLNFLKMEETKIKKKMKKKIRGQKKIIYNSLTQTIEETMKECYETAAGYSGPGMLEKMRETLSRHVNKSKDTMFDNAKNVMLVHFETLRMEILETISTLERSVEISLRADGNHIQDVSKHLEMVKKFQNQLIRLNYGTP